MGVETVPSYGWALLQMLLALLLVCALAYVALRFGLRRLVQPRGKAGRMRVIDRCPLAAGRSLWIVEVDRQQLLIGESEGGISNLGELEPQRPAVEPQRSLFEIIRRRGDRAARTDKEER